MPQYPTVMEYINTFNLSKNYFIKINTRAVFTDMQNT